MVENTRETLLLEREKAKEFILFRMAIYTRENILMICVKAKEFILF
jgi:hypothetical protein